jgi:hypothetical protein
VAVAHSLKEFGWAITHHSKIPGYTTAAMVVRKLSWILTVIV